MTYEERRVVTSDADDSVETVPTEVTTTEPETVVERRPIRRTVVSEDAVGSSFAASQLIQTVVWSVVVLVLLIVVLVILHVYLGVF
jgi:cell division protein FtsX